MIKKFLLLPFLDFLCLPLRPTATGSNTPTNEVSLRFSTAREPRGKANHGISDKGVGLSRFSALFTTYLSTSHTGIFGQADTWNSRYWDFLFYGIGHWWSGGCLFLPGPAFLGWNSIPLPRFVLPLVLWNMEEERKAEEEGVLLEAEKCHTNLYRQRHRWSGNTR